VKNKWLTKQKPSVYYGVREEKMLPDTAIGAIVAAIITSIISLVGLIISKENKVSEFRQKWIDDFREDVSQIVSHIHIINAYAAVYKTLSLDLVNNSKEHYSAVNAAISRIRLRINPKEKYADELLAEINKLEKVLSSDPALRNTSDTNLCEEKILGLSRDVLKNEWERVKSGEKTYKLTIRSIVILVVFLPVLAIVLA
jgi:cell division protein FtsL